MQLHHERERLYNQRNMRVFVVTFGNPDWVRAWLEETGVTFTVLLDEDRAVYDAYQLASSLWRVWQPSVLWYYAKKMLQGDKLTPGRGDTTQLGGDFVVDQNGQLQLTYYSDDPTDRPEITALIDTSL